MMQVNTQLSVPPGFRFHPTEEELLHYYLRKKVSYEAIDLDVIREVDLNKLEPWDLKEKCRIGSGPQNEWYFFSHKDKKYPTGTRTNRATTAGFWKATGRDKAIHLNGSKRIGMRKTLVFYIGRAPRGQKTDWIMHEYRLDDENAEIQEDGWVVCRVFKKKMTTRGFQHEIADHQEEHFTHMEASSSTIMDPKPNSRGLCHDYTFDHSFMHLPQLLSSHQSAAVHQGSFFPVPMNSTDIVECSNNLLRLTSAAGASCGGFPQQEKFSSDWSFLDKPLSSNQCFDRTKYYPLSQVAHDVVPSAQKFPFQYLGSQLDYFLNFSK